MVSIGECFSRAVSPGVAFSGLLSLFLPGCVVADWEMEEVLGDDVPAIEIEGEPGSGFGSALALGLSGLLVASQGDGRIHAFDYQGDELWCAELTAGAGTRLGWSDAGVWAWQRGVGFHFFSEDGVWIGEEVERQATAVSLCPDGLFARVYTPGASVSCSDSGLLWTLCNDGNCEVYRESQAIGTTSQGSAVAWMDGVACWGDVQLTEPDAGGAMKCEDGTSLEGMVGEHIGTALVSGRVAGQFSKWSIPARARVLDSSGGETWSVDRAAERSRISLAESEGSWAVGVPGYIGEGAQEGRVYLLTARGERP